MGHNRIIQCLQSQYPTAVLVQNLEVLFPNSPANTPGKAVDDDRSAWDFFIFVGVPDGFLGSWLWSWTI